MKKKLYLNLIFIVILMVFEGQTSNAMQEGYVVSDSEKQAEIMRSFNEVNRYSDHLFTLTPIRQNVKDEEDANIENSIYGRKEAWVEEGGAYRSFKTAAPFKRLRLRIQKKLEQKAKGENGEQAAETSSENGEQVVAAPLETKDQIKLNCENMEYFAERTELEATGDVFMEFPQNDATLKADKLIYNQTSNVIKAIGNVVITKGDQVIQGDYLFIDMNEENSILDNPITDYYQIHAVAKKGYMYGDKVIQEQGAMYVTKKTMIDMRADMMGPDLDNLYVPENQKSHLFEGSAGSRFRIHTTHLILNSKKEHDTITLRHASIYFKNKKVGIAPTITLHMNKNRDFVEGDFPEIGTLTNLGFYAGPGFVFDTPRGTTLKLIPVFNYQGGDDSPFGFGGIAKFKSASNDTFIGFGSIEKTPIVKGRQYLDDNLFFQYGTGAYIDDWFLGYRMPKLIGELVYQKDYNLYNFLAPQRTLSFEHRIAGGYIQDGIIGPDGGRLGEDGIGTFRGQYMAQVTQNLYTYKSMYTDSVNASLNLIAQGAVSLYGTGDSQIVGRIGPMIHTQYKNWMQDVGYFASTYSDNTPLIYFDQYMYGRSNAWFRESLRLCKYLTVSWLVSANLSRDSWDEKLLQENAFYLGIGPDDLRLNIGYDVVRQQSFVTLAMHLDAKGSSLSYDKLTIKNPDTFGKGNEELLNVNMYKPSNIKEKEAKEEEEYKKAANAVPFEKAIVEDIVEKDTP